MLKFKRIAIYLYVCFNKIYRQSEFQNKVISITISSNGKIEIIVWDNIELMTIKILRKNKL